MKPEEFSPLELYGDKKIFNKMLAEGFKDVAFGKGPWVQSENSAVGRAERVVGGFYFFNTNGQVAGYETVKKRTIAERSRCGNPVETHYDVGEFEKRVARLKLELSDKQDLARLILGWE